MEEENEIRKGSKKLQELHREFKKYMEKKKITEWNGVKEKLIFKFIVRWFKKAKRKKKLKPYAVENFLVNLKNILDLRIGRLPKLLISRINKKVKQEARIIFEEIEIKRSRAETFKLSTIKKAIKQLWRINAKNAEAAAICLAITFTTGARLIDALRINTRRMEKQKTEAGKFLVMKLNTSKTNPIGKHHEQLTFKISKENVIKTEKWIKKWRRKYKPEGRLFGKDIKTKDIVYQFKKISKKLGLKKMITGHSGRNTMVLELYKANVDDESKKLFMRWRANSQMPNHYRNILLETSRVGAASIMAQNNFNLKENKSKKL